MSAKSRNGWITVDSTNFQAPSSQCPRRLWSVDQTIPFPFFLHFRYIPSFRNDGDWNAFDNWLQILHFLPRCMYEPVYSVARSSFTYLNLIGSLAPVSGHYAVQGHSRSIILVPIDSPYTTSCWSIVLTEILSLTFWQISRSIINQIIAFDRVCLSLTKVRSQKFLQLSPEVISLNTVFFDYIFVADSMGLHSTNIM